MGANFRRNHYVPEWYQRRFLCGGDRFFYLDLKPDKLTRDGHTYSRRDILRWGPGKCFVEEDLYTTKFGALESTEIEEYFFGLLDREGCAAIDVLNNYAPAADTSECVTRLLKYISVQKLRTPKGLSALARMTGAATRNHLLMLLQGLQELHCAVWSESVWLVAEATRSATKFIVSDHPVTVYNRKFFPGSPTCRGDGDPDIRLNGTHTLFPLSSERILIFTNLSWVRDPYANEAKLRPNPDFFRQTMFDIRAIQTRRELDETEVQEINYILKQRAKRYIAAANRDWLFPERALASTRWDKLGKGYLLMPDPRSVTYHSHTILGYRDRPGLVFDEFGHQKGHPGFRRESERELDMATFHAFQGQFARMFGPMRRGRSFGFGKLDSEKDSESYHSSLLRSEAEFKAQMHRLRPTAARRRERKR